MAKKRKTRRKSASARSKPALAKTRKQIRATAKAVKKSRATRKLPKIKIKSRATRKLPKIKRSRARKSAKKLPSPLFKRRIIHGKGGDLVIILEPIGYRDYKDKFKRLISSPKYLALKREFPQLTYSIFGNPGNHRASSLESLVAFFETIYEPTLQAINSTSYRRNRFFSRLVIYGIKRSYSIAPPLRNAHGKRRKTRRGL